MGIRRYFRRGIGSVIDEDVLSDDDNIHGAPEGFHVKHSVIAEEFEQV